MDTICLWIYTTVQSWRMDTHSCLCIITWPAARRMMRVQQYAQKHCTWNPVDVKILPWNPMTVQQHPTSQPYDIDSLQLRNGGASQDMQMSTTSRSELPRAVFTWTVTQREGPCVDLDVMNTYICIYIYMLSWSFGRTTRPANRRRKFTSRCYCQHKDGRWVMVDNRRLRICSECFMPGRVRVKRTVAQAMAPPGYKRLIQIKELIYI